MKLLNGYLVFTMIIMLIHVAFMVVVDEFVMYDQVVLVVCLAWVLTNWTLMLQPASTANAPWHSWLVTRGIRRPHIFIAGIGMVMIVAVRHYIQVHVVYDSVIVRTDFVHILTRYGQTAVITWSIAWSYLLLSVWPNIDWRAVWHRHIREIVSLVVLIGIAVLLRGYALGLVPNLLNGDEGLIGWWATTLFTIEGPLAFVFSAIDGVGTTYLYVMSLIFAMFGQNAMSLRLLPAIAGVVAVATNYWLARQLFGPRIALLTAIMLVFAHTHIHFSRQVAVSYIYATAFMPIYLWGIWQVVATQRIWPAVVAATALMVHVNFYLDAWAWAVFLVILTGAWWIVDRAAICRAARPLAFMFGLMVLGLSPMIVWAVDFPGEFVSRLSNDGSINTGWLAREAALYNVSEIQIIYTLFEAALLAFLTKPFIDFYHAEVPILDALSAILFVGGMILLHLQLSQRRTLLLLGWFWGGVTALAVLTIPISTYHYRLFAVVPVVYLIVAYTYDALMRVIERAFGTTVTRVVLVMSMMYFAIHNVQIYRTQLAEVCRYGGDLRTQQAGILSNYLYARGDPMATVVIYGNPDEFHYGPWKTMDFMNPQMQFINMRANETVSANLVRESSLYVVVVPELYHLLPKFASEYNTNQAFTLSDCGQPILSVLKANTSP